MITKTQKEYLLPKAYDAAIRAGAAILEIYNSNAPKEVTLKSDHSPLTQADRTAHASIREYLGQTRIPLLSEEGREMLYAERKDWDLFWMVDPLDGTVEFLKGNGEFTVNIALMADNKPVFGVIYVPYKEVIYFSDEERGAFRARNILADPAASHTYAQLFEGAELLPLRTTCNQPLRIAVSRSHRNEETERLVANIRDRYPDAQIIEQGSSYKFCLLAEGTVDYYVRTTNTYEWDTAAGELILAEAGGKTVSFPDGQPLVYNKADLHNPWFEATSARCKL